MQDSTGGLKLEKQLQEKDPERFYCPYPGCNRSFAELWRLKVHYRAPPDIRGSGKERGHGTELMQCPKCGKSLKPGKHHVGCSAGRSAPRQATKRTRLALPDPSILDLALLKDDQSLLPEGTGTESLMQQLVGSFPQQMLSTDPSTAAFPDLLQQQQALQMVSQQPEFAGFAHTFGVPQQTMSLYQQMQQQDPQVVSQEQQAQRQGQLDLQTDLSAVFASFPNASIAPVQHTATTTTGPTLNFQPDDALSFLGVFDYDDNQNSLFSTEPPTPPSPPPLPSDFDHNKQNGGMLFQFSQFSQKMPSNIPTASTPNEPSTSQIVASTAESGESWTGTLGYEKTNDGDLMHILFGLPDEYPTMATVHLHQWEQPSSSGLNVHSQEQGQRQDHGSLDFESPAFAHLNTDLESSLDLHFDTMDAEDDCTAPTSHTSSLTAVEPGMTSMHAKGESSSDKHSENHAESHTSHTGLMRKEGFGCDDEMLEPHLSPAALVKGDKPVLPRTSTFERELYHLLRPCE